VLTDGPELLGLAVSDNYFTALGATAALGSTFHLSDDGQSRPGSEVVLSESAWRNRFGADVKALGKTLRINGVIATVIGVMPGEFIGTGNPPQVPDFWTPLDLQASLFPNAALRSRPELHRLQLLAFTDTGTPLAQAEAELNVIKAHARHGFRFEPRQSPRAAGPHCRRIDGLARHRKRRDARSVPVRGNVVSARRRRSERQPEVAIVSESAARRFWPDQDPIGKRLSLDLTFKGQLTAFDVVGVVRDVRSANLSRVDPAYVYLPTRPGASYNLMIRSAKGAPATSAAVRAVVEALEAGSASSVRVASLHDGPMMQSQLLMAQSLATFAAALAFIAIVLAAVGVYGVTSYLVTQRTQEIGIRMALGATAMDVLRLIVRQGVAPVFAGSIVGLALAAAASTALHSTLLNPGAPDLLFGVRPWDPVSFVVLPMILAAIAAAASYVPARRATTVDPLLALRCE